MFALGPILLVIGTLFGPHPPINVEHDSGFLNVTAASTEDVQSLWERHDAAIHPTFGHTAHHRPLEGLRRRSRHRHPDDQALVARDVPRCSGSSCYIGCFWDSSTRTLPVQLFTSSKTTVQTCQQGCTGKGYAYAGMESGNECWCGNSYQSRKLSSDSKCGVSCAGQASQKCGGSWAMNLYYASGAQSGSASNTPSSSATSKSASSSGTAGSSSSMKTSSMSSRSASVSSSSRASTTTSSSRSSSTSASSTIVAPPFWSGSYHALPSVTGSPSISAQTYKKLTSLLPQVMRNAISISTHSWELGILANSLAEVYYPVLAPFNYDYRASVNSTVPWSVLDVMVQTLSGYDWSGSPSTRSGPANPLSIYLSSSTSPVPLNNKALIDGQGALGDPCSLGAGTWIAATYFGSADLRNFYSGSRPGQDFAWAVGNQYQHLEAGPRDSNGALSQREGNVELWADMGYMIPPFLAYIGMATKSQSLLNDALSQWALESNAMLDQSTGLFNHIPNWDNKPWATGNGWMLMGFMRVVASINTAGQTGQFQQTISTYTDSVTWVFYNLFGNMGSDNLVPDYMHGTGDGTGDAAGSAMIAAAYYRFRLLAPGKVASWLDSRASDLFDAVVNQLGGDGWLKHVVNPQYPWSVYSGQSPEGQSALGLMWAARTAAGV